jgi:biotin transport system substrate-specific component
MRRVNKELVYYILCAVFAALTAACSQIQVPLPFTPVPISLATLAVLVCGGTLGAKKGALAILVYILLGAVGVPVFAGFSGGLGVIAGPTGGYIIGYLPMAVIMGLFAQRAAGASGASGDAHATGAEAGARWRSVTQAGAAKAGTGILASLLKGVPALAVLYALGTAWFMISTGMGLAESLIMCVVPFIPGDVLKIVAASVVCEALKNPMRALARA